MKDIQYENVQFDLTIKDYLKIFSGLEYINRKDLTEKQIEAITQYKLNSNDINGFLRKDYSVLIYNKTVIDHIPQIDTAFDLELSIILSPIIVFRGISNENAEEFISHSAYIEDGFVSTTFNLKEAYEYSKYYNKQSSQKPNVDEFTPILLISCNPGEKAIYINHWEFEILLDRALIWSVITEKRYNSVTITLDHENPSKQITLNKVRFIYVQRK